MKTKRAFYDYQAKYEDDDTEYFCPSGLSDEKEKEIQQLALDAFNELLCTGWGRVDFIKGHDEDFYLLEVNTVPGLTSHSLVPMEAKVRGIDFPELVICILETSLQRSEVCRSTIHGAVVGDFKESETGLPVIAATWSISKGIPQQTQEPAGADSRAVANSVEKTPTSNSLIELFASIARGWKREDAGPSLGVFMIGLG